MTVSKEHELSIEEIHRETLIILKKIIEISEKININYFMMYGSLLGVVRHKGFIPWDDDCDIAMVRPDYDKFIAYCTEHEDELYPYKIMNRNNTPDYPFNISRFCDMRYRMVSTGAPDAGMGMFIDVYPLDAAGNKSEFSKLFLIKQKILFNNVFSCYYKNFHSTEKGILHDTIRYILFVSAKLFGAKFWLNRLEKNKDKYSYENSKYISGMIWDDVVNYEKDSFLDYKKLRFENLEVKVPGNYKTLLELWYGDYMQLPPEDRRVSSHDYKLYKKEI